MNTLFVSDLDGTLLTKNECVSAYSVEHINSLIDRGLPFTFATARSVHGAKGALQGLKIQLPAVFYNGALIYDIVQNRTLTYHCFDDALKQELLSKLEEFDITPLVFGAVPDRERVVWLEGKESPSMQRYLAWRKGDKRLTAAHSKEELLNGYVFTFKCVGPGEKMERAWNVLKYDPRIICIYHKETYQEDYWIDISVRSATKANGVRYLKEHFGCEKLVCFGDSSNDSDMFDVCDEKYAVMNADSWLKEKATGVIGYCEEDGVAKWLDENAFRG